jgi:hypothetical protein
MAEVSNVSGTPEQPEGSHIAAKKTATEDTAPHLPPVDSGPEQFIAFAREAFLTKKYKLNGSIPSDRKREERIDCFVDTSRLVRAEIERVNTPEMAKSFPAAAKRLLRCFERLCVRTNLLVNDAEFRTQSYQYLLSQLAHNTQFFGFNPKVLVTATLMSKVPLTELPEADLCATSPEVSKLFYRAFAGHSQSIERFFAEGKERMSELDEVLKQEKCYLPRSCMITYAYFHTSTPVVELLRRHMDLINQMCGEEQFKRLPRSLVEMVVARRKPGVVQEELERIDKDSVTLMRDADLQRSFAARPSDIVYAVSKHTHGAKEYLLSVVATEQRLIALHKELRRKITAKDLRVLCLKDPTGARRLEVQLKEELEKSRRGASDTQDNGGELPTWML